jgi:hypothetical protein
MHCLIVFPLFLEYLTDAKYMIRSRPVASKSTLMIPNNFLNNNNNNNNNKILITYIFSNLALRTLHLAE